jgi:diguanylate cyclase (GGDEF)-like protein
VLQLWRAASGDAAVVRSQRDAERIAAKSASELPQLELTVMLPVFAEGMRRMDLYNRVPAAAADATRQVAQELEEDATRSFHVAAAIVFALIVLALALTVAVSRSIARPLRGLAARAARVSAGDVADVRVRERGPRELRNVSSTLGEVVTNVRLVEEQLGALAAGRVGDPVLARPVPGRLGSFLHAAVARLSQSIAERERLARQLAFEASHDPLTGLPNHNRALDSLRHALARAARDGRGVAVLILDLDGFKRVNNQHGHHGGDRMLHVVGRRLAAQVRAGDVVARLAGDEFALIVEGIENPDEVADFARRLIAAVEAPVPLGGALTRVTASVGVAIDLDGGDDADRLLREASHAVARAKTDGGGRVAFFDTVMYAEQLRRAEIEAQLRVALERDELVLHFQPVVRPSLHAVGAEALVRWERDGALVPPNEFIPVAEASDLIIDIGRVVLRRACEQLARWSDDPRLRTLHVAVNLSPRHLSNLTVVDDVRRALEATGVEASRLVVEITETALVDDPVLAAEHLSEIRSLGVRTALDDFGTGYTSLAHLRRLPVDIIKVDRSLVVAGAEDTADARVLGLVVGTAHALGMQVVAEGIETAAQCDLVASLGCDELQGYLVSRPVPAGEFERLDLPVAA